MPAGAPAPHAGVEPVPVVTGAEALPEPTMPMAAPAPQTVVAIVPVDSTVADVTPQSTYQLKNSNVDA